MDDKEFLIGDGEHDSFKKTRDIIVQALDGIEKEFRDPDFASSHCGRISIGVASFMAVILIKLDKAKEDMRDEDLDKLMTDVMKMASCLDEAQEWLGQK